MTDYTALNCPPGSVIVVGPNGHIKVYEKDGETCFSMERCNLYGPTVDRPEVVAVRDLVWREFDDTGAERLKPANIPDINR